MQKTSQSRADDAVNQTGGGGTERGRRPSDGPTPPDAPATAGTVPSSAGLNEVPEKPTRRRFAADYKLRILEQADCCTEQGALGALLRREGLYSSHLGTWRKQRDQGILDGLTPRKRGRKPQPRDPLVDENQRLERENRKLLARLEKAEIIIEFQKKLSILLDIPLQTPPHSETDA